MPFQESPCHLSLSSLGKPAEETRSGDEGISPYGLVARGLEHVVLSKGLLPHHFLSQEAYQSWFNAMKEGCLDARLQRCVFWTEGIA